MTSTPPSRRARAMIFAPGHPSSPALAMTTRMGGDTPSSLRRAGWRFGCGVLWRRAWTYAIGSHAAGCDRARAHHALLIKRSELLQPPKFALCN